MPAIQEQSLTAEVVRAHLHYDPETGDFIRLIAGRGRRSRVGDIAGNLRVDGYRQISFNGRLWLSHRLAWLHVTGEWPDEQIDHINGVKDDNRWANLRAASHGQNQANRAAYNKIGIKGVHYDHGRWRATITSRGETKRLGAFDTKEAAQLAYAEAALKAHGPFARLA